MAEACGGSTQPLEDLTQPSPILPLPYPLAVSVSASLPPAPASASHQLPTREAERKGAPMASLAADAYCSRTAHSSPDLNTSFVAAGNLDPRDGPGIPEARSGVLGLRDNAGTDKGGRAGDDMASHNINAAAYFVTIRRRGREGEAAPLASTGAGSVGQPSQHCDAPQQRMAPPEASMVGEQAPSRPPVDTDTGEAGETGESAGPGPKRRRVPPKKGAAAEASLLSSRQGQQRTEERDGFLTSHPPPPPGPWPLGSRPLRTAECSSRSPQSLEPSIRRPASACPGQRLTGGHGGPSAGPDGAAPHGPVPGDVESHSPGFVIVETRLPPGPSEAGHPGGLTSVDNPRVSSVGNPPRPSQLREAQHAAVSRPIRPLATNVPADCWKGFSAVPRARAAAEPPPVLQEQLPFRAAGGSCDGSEATAGPRGPTAELSLKAAGASSASISGVLAPRPQSRAQGGDTLQGCHPHKPLITGIRHPPPPPPPPAVAPPLPLPPSVTSRSALLPPPSGEQHRPPPSLPGQQQPGYKFVEVVRGKAEREALEGTACRQCRQFYAAVASWGGGGAPGGGSGGGPEVPACGHQSRAGAPGGGSAAAMGTAAAAAGHDARPLQQEASRHRHRYGHQRRDTQPGFWAMGFESSGDEDGEPGDGCHTAATRLAKDGSSLLCRRWNQKM